jgi:cyclopropane-fatty-acyl-phospholipid synthase
MPPSLRALDVLLSRMPAGSLTLSWPGGERRYEGAQPGPDAHVHIRSGSAARRIITRGGTGLAEGYMDQDWDTPDLKAVLDLGMENLAITDLGNRVPPIAAPIQRLWHRLRDNNMTGSKRNIEYHYDLGNDFYELWLDDTMTYSAAMFQEPDACGSESLTAAQHRKWNALLERLEPSRGDHLLEIGCGWGGFAMHAAREAGCRVTGVTLSQEQHDWAVKRIAEEGLDGLIEIRLQDYRVIPERFDGIASIEMFEAVGERWWPVFFSRVRELLADGGRAAIQTITIAEETFEHYRSNPDFIQRYIFPGGMLPSPERFALAASDADLKVGEPEFFGRCYAATLEKWLERFEEVVPSVHELGFDERFVRMWRYYLAYCRTGFRNGVIDVMQVALEP